VDWIYPHVKINVIFIYQLKLHFVNFMHFCLFQVLTGSVASCEDHGYVIDLGIKRMNAFVRKQEAEKYLKQLGGGASYFLFSSVLIDSVDFVVDITKNETVK
jgi:hypothetical protein